MKVLLVVCDGLGTGDAPDAAAAQAKTVMAIETQLAKASLTKVERRDPEKLYHRLKSAEVRALAAKLWKSAPTGPKSSIEPEPSQERLEA